MAIRVKTTQQDEALDIIEVEKGRLEVSLLGESPLIFNSMSEKARRELLLPGGKKTAADKAINVKHDPMREFRDSIYYSTDPKSPTLLVLKSTCFKQAIMGAALDIPGAKKAQMGRLMYVVGDVVPIYGLPEMMMAVTRSAGMDRTPDIRTRAVVPAWCTHFFIEFVTPVLKGTVIQKLLIAAGMTQGVGDWRVEKGSGNYGRFIIVNPDHEQFKFLTDHCGRDIQQEAMKNPSPYDSETKKLFSWYETEVTKRGIKLAA